MTAELPHDVLVGLLNSAGKAAAAAKGSEILRQKVEGRPIALKVKINIIEKELRRADNAEGYRMKPEDVFIHQGGANFRIAVWVHFLLSENDKLGSYKKGAEISFKGKVDSTTVVPENGLRVDIDINDGTVK